MTDKSLYWFLVAHYIIFVLILSEFSEFLSCGMVYQHRFLTLKGQSISYVVASYVHMVGGLLIAIHQSLKNFCMYSQSTGGSTGEDEELLSMTAETRRNTHYNEHPEKDKNVSGSGDHHHSAVPGPPAMTEHKHKKSFTSHRNKRLVPNRQHQEPVKGSPVTYMTILLP